MLHVRLILDVQYSSVSAVVAVAAALHPTMNLSFATASGTVAEEQRTAGGHRPGDFSDNGRGKVSALVGLWFSGLVWAVYELENIVLTGSWPPGNGTAALPGCFHFLLLPARR